MSNPLSEREKDWQELEKARERITNLKFRLEEAESAYEAAHSELVRANKDLAACREVANGLRKDLDKEREAYTVLRSNTLILRAKVNTLESVLLQMHAAIAQYFPLGEMPRSFLVAVERYVGLPK
jgi:chromosome segregation ATPase